MKRSPEFLPEQAEEQIGPQHAFTLPELTITVMVSMIVMAGLLAAYLFGLRLFEFTKPKLSASDNARNTIGRIVGELRSADRIQLGQGSLSTFTEIPDGERQEGNAIKVYSSTNDTFIIYYHDAADLKLKRATNGAVKAEVMATSVSNRVVFTSEDFAGNVLTNNSGNRVIGLNLEFYQIEYPIVQIGPDGFYDSYQVRTKVTKRKLPQP